MMITSFALCICLTILIPHLCGATSSGRSTVAKAITSCAEPSPMPTMENYGLRPNTSSNSGKNAAAWWPTASFTITPPSCLIYWLTNKAWVIIKGPHYSNKSRRWHGNISTFTDAMSSEGQPEVSILMRSWGSWLSSLLGRQWLFKSWNGPYRGICKKPQSWN